MNTNLLRIHAIQTELISNNAIANIKHIDEKINNIHESDIIVLPEMFTTGFSMKIENAELFDNNQCNSLTQLKKWSKLKDALVCGSVMVYENKPNNLIKYYNRLFVVQPNGDFNFYDKRHLFRMANEDDYFTNGNQKLIINYKNWNICFLICYDLRFPVWSRNKENSYDVLIYVANWPSARKEAWKTLLKARAIENLSYCVGVNRIGHDIENDILYSGDSQIIDFKGEVLNTNSTTEVILNSTFSKEQLNDFRTKFPANLDADKFEIL